MAGMCRNALSPTCPQRTATSLRELAEGSRKFLESEAVWGQAAINQAARQAGAFGRHLESTEDAAILSQLERENKARTHQFTQRDELLRLAEPVKAAYAKEINAQQVLARINALE